MRGSRFGIAASWLVVGSLAALGAACTRDGNAGEGRAPTTSTSPPHARSRGAVLDPSVPVAFLPEGPIQGTPQWVGNHGEDLIAFGGTIGGGAHDRPTDVTALLDSDTFSWTRLPDPPFEHPTAWPAAAAVGDELVVSGYSCDPDTEPMATYGPDCAWNELQTARLDLVDGTWDRLPDPPGHAELWATPTGVLASSPGRWPTTVPVVEDWSFLPLGADRWIEVERPPFPVALACGSGDTVVAYTVEATQDAVAWAAPTLSLTTSADRFGHVRAVFWDDGRRAWSAPTPPVVDRPLDSVGAACVPGAFLWFNVRSPLSRLGNLPADTADAGIYVARSGLLEWERRPWDPPDAGTGPGNLVGWTQNTMRSPAAVVFPSMTPDGSALYVVDSATWTGWPTVGGDRTTATDGVLLGRTVATTLAGGLVAIRIG